MQELKPTKNCILDVEQTLRDLPQEELRERMLSVMYILLNAELVSQNKYMSSEENMVRYIRRARNTLLGAG